MKILFKNELLFVPANLRNDWVRKKFVLRKRFDKFIKFDMYAGASAGKVAGITHRVQ